MALSVFLSSQFEYIFALFNVIHMPTMIRHKLVSLLVYLYQYAMFLKTVCECVRLYNVLFKIDKLCLNYCFRNLYVELPSLVFLKKNIIYR